MENKLMMKTRQSSLRLNRSKQETEPTSGTKESESKTDVKTPKVKKRRSDQWSRTPGRDDFIFSQHFDSQTVVGWDCHSPEHVRSIRKFSGSDGNAIPDLLKLITEEEEDAITEKRTTLPLLEVWKDTTRHEDRLLDNVLPNNRCRQRKRHREKSRKDVDDYYRKLTLALDKNKDNDSTDPKNDVGEVNPENDEADHDAGAFNVSDDLFANEDVGQWKDTNANKDIVDNNTIDADDKKTVVKEQVDFNKEPVRVSPRLRQRIGQTVENKVNDITRDGVSSDTSVKKSEASGGTVNKANEKPGTSKVVGTTGNVNAVKDNAKTTGKGQQEIDDDSWSDDELFEEDSFIIKATQVPEDVKTYVSPVFSTNKRKISNIVGGPQSKYCRTAAESMNNTRSATNNIPKNNIGTNAVAKCTSGVSNNPYTCIQNKVVSVSSATSRIQTNTIVSTANRNSVVSSVIASKAPVSSVPTQQNLFNPSNKVNNNYNTGFRPCCATGNSLGNAVKNNNFKKYNSFSGLQCQSSTHSRKRSLSGDFEQGEKACKSGVGKPKHFNLPQQPVLKFYSLAGNSRLGSAPNSTRQSNTNSVSSTIANFRPPCKTVPSNTVPNTRLTTTTNQAKPISTSSVYTSVACGGKPIIPTDSKPRVKTKVDTLSSVSEFDTSLSDDLLCELAEPDDILDSQICVQVVASKSSSVSCSKQGVINSVVSCSVSKTSTISSSKRNTVNNSVTAQINKSNPVVVPVSKCVPVKPNQPPQTRQFRFRESQRSTKDGNKTTPPGNSTTAVPVAVKQTKLAEDYNQYSEDLFDDDDLMMNDGLTEPQILAMLDEVEMIATQQSNCGKPTISTSMKATAIQSNTQKPLPNTTKAATITKPQALSKPQTIMKPVVTSKPQTIAKSGTLPKLQKNSIVKQTIPKSETVSTKPGNSEPKVSDKGNTNNQDISGSQGQPSSQNLSNSQNKYSPEEIERKKQLALAKRKLRSQQNKK